MNAELKVQIEKKWKKIKTLQKNERKIQTILATFLFLLLPHLMHEEKCSILTVFAWTKWNINV